MKQLQERMRPRHSGSLITFSTWHLRVCVNMDVRPEQLSVLHGQGKHPMCLKHMHRAAAPPGEVYHFSPTLVASSPCG